MLRHADYERYNVRLNYNNVITGHEITKLVE